MGKYIFIGVPYWLGKTIDGRTEVTSIQQSGIAEEFDAEWVTIEPEFSIHDDPVIAVNQAIADMINAYPDKIPVVFASDCTSCLGMVKGLESQAPAILWYDSHGDFNIPETSPSGFLGGMPLAAMVGRGNEYLLEGMDLEPLNESDIIVTDVRNLDPQEGEMLRGSDITIYESVNDLLTADLSQKPLYIHFDTDVVDIGDMPAMNYPEADGPSLKDTAKTLQHVVNNTNTVGILFSLWNDTLDGADKALAGTLELVRTLK